MQTSNTQTITKKYNGNAYTTGETWKSNSGHLPSNYGVIAGFTKEGIPVIELDTGDIELLLNPSWIKVNKTAYYVYRTGNGHLMVTEDSTVNALHTFTLEE